MGSRRSLIKALALGSINLRVAFMTHLHSDHTVGYPDLILTPWVLGRRFPSRCMVPAESRQ